MNATQKVEKVRMIVRLIEQNMTIQDLMSWTTNHTLADMNRAGMLTADELIRISEELTDLRDRAKNLTETLQCIKHENMVPYND